VLPKPTPRRYPPAGSALRIVDRIDELAAVRSLLVDDEVRLITLTGPAGVGKTRLVLEVAAHLAPHFADGVVFVDLSPVRDPSLVVEALAQSLDIDDGPADESVPDRLEAALGDRAMLIILDNAEQVLPGASYLAELLLAAPHLAVLVTSREALHLRWEQIFPVPPLALPDLQRLPSLEELAAIPAIALFLQRAQAIDPTFALRDDTAQAVAELCVHMDGLPLAIELAAARTALLSPQMILERLGQRLSLLRWQAHDLPERQQTLRSAIAWSYELLCPQEQTLFRHLGIFAGSFSLRAVEAVAEPLAMDALECLASLVDKSLVQVHDRDEDTVRYVLLESMREYARERLVEAGEQEETGRLHARYYLSLTGRAEPELFGPERRSRLARLEGAQDNLRAARCWLLDHDEGALALRLTTTLEQLSALREQSLEGAVPLAARGTCAAERAQPTILSPREQEVLQLVARGRSNKQIARTIIVGETTVKSHITSIFNKLGVDNRAQAVAVAVQRGFVLLGQAT
jgi:predicted ATPase/DNA-binding CsgD family transcriptional regulator